MHKIVALRFALPAIAILTVVAIAIIATAMVTGGHPGTAWGFP